MQYRYRSVLNEPIRNTEEAYLDIAETMVTEAIAFNAELVAAGQASFRLASAEAIPCPDESFEKVFAVNVIYFWPDPVRALSEMRRVLRAGGMSVIAALNPDPDQPLYWYGAPADWHVSDAAPSLQHLLVTLNAAVGSRRLLAD